MSTKPVEGEQQARNRGLLSPSAVAGGVLEVSEPVVGCDAWLAVGVFSCDAWPSVGELSCDAWLAKSGLINQ
jgi:hypothetical protein